MIVRSAALYLAVFVAVLFALSVGAYAFMYRYYASLLQPLLGTPEFGRGIGIAMQRVTLTIVTIDLPLIVVVGLASYVLARTTIAPIEAARERERVFAADAAHELRSPLATIAAIAQAARSDAPPESRAAFDSIVQNSLDASAIVSDLLTLARHPGRAVLQCEPVDLAGVVAGCARDLAALGQARGVAVEADPRSAIVNGDERRLKELARNLAENALRHARGRIRIASRRHGRTCELIVEDDGPGVPPAERERIFERFYRGAHDGAGTGLGLAIVRWIAHAHHGSIAVADARLGGARFVLSLDEGGYRPAEA